MSVISSLLDKQKIILLDSAMGTELQNRGLNVSLPLWSAGPITENPDTIRMIHIENADAGADIITTNTFRTQKRIFEQAGFQYEGKNYSETAFEMTKLACELAMEAKMITNDDLIIAGGIAPLADCYYPEDTPDIGSIEAEQAEHIGNLIEADVDMLLAETLSDANEISVLLNLLDESEMEYMISLIVRDENTLYSGEDINDTIDKINRSKSSALLVNCISPNIVNNIIQSFKTKTNLILGVYANVGNSRDLKSNGFVKPEVTVHDYTVFAKEWINNGIKIIGGCCGTNSEYIRSLNKFKH